MIVRPITQSIGLVVFGFAMATASVSGDSGSNSSAVNAHDLLLAARAHRADKDVALKARLSLTRTGEKIPVDILIQHRPDETRTIYATGSTEALIVQPNAGPARYFVRGTGELHGDARLQKLAGSQFTFYDLGLPFLHWTDAKYIGMVRQRGRECHIVEVTKPGEPYAAVKLWLDRDYRALLRAEAMNEHGQPIRRFTVTSFRKIGDGWMPRGLEMSSVPHGQALPATETSRLEIYQGDDNATLPPETFALERFESQGADSQ